MVISPIPPEARPVRLLFDRGTLVLEGLGQGVPPAPGGQVWRWDERTGNYRCAALHYREVRQALAGQLGPEFQDQVRRPPAPDFPRVSGVDIWRGIM